MGLGKLNREAVRQVHVVASDSRLDVETVSIVTYAFSASVGPRPTRRKHGRQCGWSDLTTHPRLFLNGQPGNDGFRKFEELCMCLTDVAIVCHNDEHCVLRWDQHEQ
jgi:hypothetical protein